MKVLKFLPLFVIFLLIVSSINSQKQAGVTVSDSLTLAQAFINLSLTETYFDSISLNRIDKILPFELEELNTIKSKTFITKNATVYNLAWSMYYVNKAKRLLKITTSPNRKQLLVWKNALDSAHLFYNKVSISSDYFVERKTDPYFELIGFNDDVYRKLSMDLDALRSRFTLYFNRDIYADFKRIFYTAKTSNIFYFDSLHYYASLYSIPISLQVLNNVPEFNNKFTFNTKTPYIGTQYTLAQGLDIIVKYLQYAYLASDKVSNRITINNNELYQSYDDFISELNFKNPTKFSDNDGIITRDEFFKAEINEAVINKLLKNLQNKFPDDGLRQNTYPSTGMAGPDDVYISKYYFPNPAPFPSSMIYVRNFKPALKTMKQVNDYMVPILNAAGYKTHLHYYYVKSGFAMSTDLEKITKEGKPVEGVARWNVSTSGNGSFSLYQVFKSIFFVTESHFRMFAFIIAPKVPDLSPRPPSLSAIGDLVKYSYSSLPSDIHNSTLNNKTLSILVYHFLQSDIGEVPMLQIKNSLPAKNHVNNSKLGALLIP